MKIRTSIVAAGVAVAGALAIGLAPAASAADRGGNGLIAFSHAGSQIAVLGAGGTETILTPSGGNQAWPAFSPDGTRIAFVQAYHLWIMNANGSKGHAVPVTGNPYEGGPAWSPNATKLAYVNGTDGQLYTIPVAGGTPIRITSGITEMADIRWSPDNTKIAFDAKDTAGTGYRQIFSVNVTTKAVTRLTSGGCDSVEPDWSPTGTQVAFSTPCFDGTGNIGVMPAAGGAASPVALLHNAAAGYPSWSPDGTEIVFAANELMGSEQLWESSPSNPGDGTHVTATQLTHDSGQPYNTAPSWQPVHHPHLALSASTGAPGATVTVTGSDFLSGQTVKLSFVDAHGITTALGSAKTPLNGGFTSTVTIPAGAAAGAGKIKATGVGGLSATKTFTVS
jgi:Tol biopolymer transport system component